MEQFSEDIRRHLVGLPVIAHMDTLGYRGIKFIKRHKAEQIVKFLEEMLSAVSPAKLGKDVTVAEVLEQASPRVEKELAGQPEIEAKPRTTIGNTYRELGLYKEAENHLSNVLSIRQAKTIGLR